MNTTLETCRILYNRLLAGRKEAYEQTGKSPSRYEQQAMLPEWKRENSYLSLVYSQVVQEVGARVERSYQNFFRRCKEGKEKAGFPRFKSFGTYDSFTFPQSGFELQDNSVKLSKVGTVEAIVHRRIDGKIKNCTIRRQNEKWFACFAIEVESVPLPANGEGVGVDVGISSFATFSNGEFIENPRFYRKDEVALAKAQRRMAKFEKGTKERRKARKVVARIHERIRNRRHNFVHQEARKIVNRFEVIAVEKLNVKGMAKNHCLAKSIGDAAWSQFRTVLSNKAANAGRKLVAVSPSSRYQKEFLKTAQGLLSMAGAHSRKLNPLRLRNNHIFNLLRSLAKYLSVYFYYYGKEQSWRNQKMFRVWGTRAQQKVP